jgi:hypothetical protein
MGKPLIVVSTLRVKQGRLEDVTRYYKKILELIEAKGMLKNNLYF